MEKIVFGFRKENASAPVKLIVCSETKEYELGQYCRNDYHTVDVWVKQKDLRAIEGYLLSVGFLRTDERFGALKRGCEPSIEEYKQWCEDNGLSVNQADSLTEFKKYMESIGRW